MAKIRKADVTIPSGDRISYEVHYSPRHKHFYPKGLPAAMMAHYEFDTNPRQWSTRDSMVFRHNTDKELTESVEEKVNEYFTLSSIEERIILYSMTGKYPGGQTTDWRGDQVMHPEDGERRLVIEWKVYMKYTVGERVVFVEWENVRNEEGSLQNKIAQGYRDYSHKVKGKTEIEWTKEREDWFRQTTDAMEILIDRVDEVLNKDGAEKLLESIDNGVNLLKA